jgi:hypothetical protein
MTTAPESQQSTRTLALGVMDERRKQAAPCDGQRPQ